MKTLTLLVPVVLAAAVTAGCGSSAPAAAPTSPARTAPPTCSHQYAAWKYGPARAVAKALVTDVRKVQAAGNAMDIPELTAALRKLGPDVSALQRYPMPRCADPAGYWATFLIRIKAASDNAKTGSGLGSLLLVMVPLKTLPGLEAKLQAELRRTAGVK